MARKMANQEKKHKKQIETHLSELITTADKKRYLEEQKTLAKQRIRNKIAKGQAKFEKRNAELGLERKRKTSFKPGSDEKLLKRINTKLASLEAEEEDGDQAAKRGMGGKQIKSGNSLSYRTDET